MDLDEAAVRLGGRVLIAAGAVTVTVPASAGWLERHGGWPHLVTAHGDTDEMERARITGQFR